MQLLNTANLETLHHIIQIAMGWTDSHLHQFTISGVDYGQPMPEYDDFEVSDESKAKLSRLVAEKSKFLYTYDMGDSWDHEILVEKILPREADRFYPTCLTGKRACPPEDCGGVWRYAEFVAAIQDPAHPNHEDMLEWIGGDFDPEEFDPEEVNQQFSAMKW